MIEFSLDSIFFFFFQAEDGIRDVAVTGVQTCALPISSKSLNPNRIKNSFDVLYRIGRPITSLRPAVEIKCLSSSVLITPAVFTPRISEISGAVTGCLYAITASVSSAGIDNLRSEEHTSELQSRLHLVCRLLLE